jgi:hypothetical protein
MMTQVYDADAIRDKLKSNDKWLVRGILAIYAKQTADEKSSQTTNHNNSVGFNGRDAGILSSFAKQILTWQATENPRYDSPLSPKQFALARRAMPKYAGQLARIAAENNPVEDEGTRYDSYDAEAAAEMQAEAEAEARAERTAVMVVERFDDLVGEDDAFGWD